MGGLGNQLFQYAIGHHVADVLGGQLELDARSLTSTHDGIGLTAFRSPDAIISASTMSRRGAAMASARLRLPPPLVSVLSDSDAVADFLRAPSSFGTVRLQGFFQDLPIDVVEQFVRERSPVLRAPSPWFERTSADIGASRPIAVHIRRGDFALMPEWGLLATDYYTEALRRLRVEDRPVWVFTDDVGGCRGILEGLKRWDTVLVQPPSGIPAAESLMLLAKCPTIVGSNSTFAYWACALSGGERFLPAYFRPGSAAAGHDVTPLSGVGLLDPVWE